MEILNSILGWFQSASWTEVSAAVALWIIAFDRLAKITPSESDNRIVAFLYKAFAVLGVKFPDVK